MSHKIKFADEDSQSSFTPEMDSRHLVRDLFLHLETSRDVAIVEEFPEEIEYWSVATNGEPTLRRHTAHASGRTRDGVHIVFEAMSLREQRSHRGLRQRTADLQAHYARINVRYILVDERTLHKQPAFDNLRIMWQHKRSDGQHPDIDLTAGRVLEQPLPLEIRELARCLAPEAAGAVPGAQTVEDLCGSLVFTAVLQLAMAGVIEVDLDRPFSGSSVVRPADGLIRAGCKPRISVAA